MNEKLKTHLSYTLSKEKSLHIFQYKCSCKPKRWWGSVSNNKCKRCGKTVQPLSLEQTLGIGWFECPCRRLYAGFSRGDVTSKCFGCQRENFPSFIVPGDQASKDEKSDKSHFCSVCHGNGNCPIVAQAARENE